MNKRLSGVIVCVVMLLVFFGFSFKGGLSNHKRTYYLKDTLSRGTLTIEDTKAEDVFKCTYKGNDFVGNPSNTIEISGSFILMKIENGEKWFSSTLTGYDDYYWVMSSSGDKITYFIYDFEK